MKRSALPLVALLLSLTAACTAKEEADDETADTKDDSAEEDSGTDSSDNDTRADEGGAGDSGVTSDAELDGGDVIADGGTSRDAGGGRNTNASDGGAERDAGPSEAGADARPVEDAGPTLTIEGETTVLDFDPSCREWEDDECRTVTATGFPAISADAQYVAVITGDNYRSYVYFHSVVTGRVVATAVLSEEEELLEAQFELEETGKTDVFDRIGARLSDALERIAAGGYTQMIPAEEAGYTTLYSSEAGASGKLSFYATQDCSNEVECGGAPEFIVNTDHRDSRYDEGCGNQTMYATAWLSPQHEVHATRINESTQDLCSSPTPPWVVGGYDPESLAETERRASLCPALIDGISPTAHDGTEDRAAFVYDELDAERALDACPELNRIGTAVEPISPNDERQLHAARFVEESLGVELILLRVTGPECTAFQCAQQVYGRDRGTVYYIGEYFTDSFGYVNGQLAIEVIRLFDSAMPEPYWAVVVPDGITGRAQLHELP